MRTTTLRMPQAPPTAAGPSDEYLSVHVATKSYPNRERPVLTDFDVTVARGEFVSLLGPSGCGKTTLLGLIAGLDTAYDGQIILDGRLVTGPGADRGVVFQESRLLPWMTVAQNVAFAVAAHTEDAAQRIDAVLGLVGLAEFKESWPRELSGGMEKRAALARALVNVPKLLLLDEPLTGLDSFAKYAMQDEIARVHKVEGVTTLLVTHDIDEAIYLSDRIAILSSSPATIIRTIHVTQQRPRARDSRAYAELRSELLRELLGH